MHVDIVLESPTESLRARFCAATEGLCTRVGDGLGACRAKVCENTHTRRHRDEVLDACRTAAFLEKWIDGKRTTMDKLVYGSELGESARALQLAVHDAAHHGLQKVGRIRGIHCV